ncbi:MAG: ATP-binding protein [Candidatus Symbiothrix sp.]|jgi:predicted ATP-dependent endonuclease of OLD family|nr:ATP-binding protein [Candidatus Symbiothrix sp.]
MKETIIIRNFGPINEIEIDDIRPLTVFIGESGSGKSTIMKVIVLFRWIYKMVSIRSYLKHANISQSPFTFNFKSYLKNNGFVDYIKSNTEIIYTKGNNSISYKGSLDSSITIPKNELSLDKMCFIADKRNLIPDILAAKKVDTMGFFLRETFTDFGIASEFIKELDIDYLGVKYLSKQTPSGVKYYIENIGQDEKYTINLEDASSGTQTIVPLSVIIEYFTKYYDFSGRFNKIIFNYMSQSDNLKDFRAEQNIGEINHKNVHIHIEEPELSLYPESQRSLINFIVNRCFVQEHNGYDMTVMMATHSPYIINHLNLLIKAYDKNKLIDGAKLSYDNLSVYQVAEGRIIDLKIQNERLINTNPLSDTINAIYNQYEEIL